MIVEPIDERARPLDSLVSRLLVARTTGHAPRDLIDAVLELLPAGKPAADCRAMRDALLREAASLLTGSTWQRAETLADLIRRFHRPTDAVRRLLWQADRTGAKLPTSARQVFRIIGTD